MRKMKRLMVVMLLVAAIGGGVPPSAFADGPSETPGATSTGPSGPPSRPGPTETLSFFEMLLNVWSLTFLP